MPEFLGYVEKSSNEQWEFGGNMKIFKHLPQSIFSLIEFSHYFVSGFYIFRKTVSDFYRNFFKSL